jgi:hypothetical protein
MIWFLRVLFAVVFASMVGVTTWASLHQPLGDFARSATFREPWVIATLADAYWAFLAFYVWVAWKERSLLARVLWLPVLLALGNLGIAAYMLRELCRVPAAGPGDAALATVFTERRATAGWLPGVLTTGSVAVYLLA